MWDFLIHRDRVLTYFKDSSGGLKCSKKPGKYPNWMRQFIWCWMSYNSYRPNRETLDLEMTTENRWLPQSLLFSFTMSGPGNMECSKYLWIARGLWHISLRVVYCHNVFPCILALCVFVVSCETCKWSDHVLTSTYMHLNIHIYMHECEFVLKKEGIEAIVVVVKNYSIFIIVVVMNIVK